MRGHGVDAAVQARAARAAGAHALEFVPGPRGHQLAQAAGAGAEGHVEAAQHLLVPQVGRRQGLVAGVHRLGLLRLPPLLLLLPRLGLAVPPGEELGRR